MAEGWDFVSCERRAYKQGFTSSWATKSAGIGTYYTSKDAVGETVSDAGACPWDDTIPMGLATELNVDHVVEKAGQILSTTFGRHVRAHEDAGTYCCGFIYYESLANKASTFTFFFFLFFFFLFLSSSSCNP
jgi:pyroglutamyl-peptidase